MSALKVFYAAGPGNVVETYRYYLTGEHDPSQVAITYSGQFFDVCRELGLRARVVTTHGEADRIAADGIEIENWPCPWMGRRGVRYYLGSLLYHLRLMAAIAASRARHVIYFDNEHWFMLAPIHLLGVKVVVTLHSRLWVDEPPRRGLHGWITRLNGWYFRRCASGVMCVSEEAAGQVRELVGAATPVRVFSPTYSSGTFVPAPRPTGEPKRVLFVGRVEANKGVLDLVDIAATLRDRGRRDLLFDICGDGSALEVMKERARALGLEDSFRFRGYTRREELPAAFRESTLVVVPTQGKVTEGFNKVVAETVLAGRPAITSTVCPAASELGGAVVLVPPDSIVGYADAIESVLDDPDRYDEMVRAGEPHRARFHDREAGWGPCMKSFLLDLVPALMAREGEAARADVLG